MLLSLAFSARPHAKPVHMQQPARYCQQAEARCPCSVMTPCMLWAGSDGGSAASWLDSGGSRAGLAALQASTIVADEPLTLTVPITNPMAIPLSLSRLRLACSHSACQDDDSLSQFVQVAARLLHRLASWGSMLHPDCLAHPMLASCPKLCLGQSDKMYASAL